MISKFGMKKTKKEAVSDINYLIQEISAIANAGLNSSEHIRWMFNCRNVLENIFGKNSTYYRSFAALTWRDTGSFPIFLGFQDYDEVVNSRNYQAFIRCLEVAQGIFLAAIDDIERSDDISELYKDRREDDSNLLIKLLNVIENKFRIFFHEEPQKEKDVQDNFEKLLAACDFSYTREKERITYSSKTYIPDFVLADMNMALEIKFCNRDNREKEIISEINDDILAYKTKYKNIMFLIYDIGQIRDIELFKGSFKEHNNVIIVITKH